MFRKNLKEIRENRGLTQHELCKLSGHAPSAISMFENGKREPTLSSLIKIKNALQCSYDLLIDGFDLEIIDNRYHLKTLKNKKILDGLYEILKQTEG